LPSRIRRRHAGELGYDEDISDSAASAEAFPLQLFQRRHARVKNHQIAGVARANASQPQKDHEDVAVGSVARGDAEAAGAIGVACGAASVWGAGGVEAEALRAGASSERPVD
jgi:hypothetical protein